MRPMLLLTWMAGCATAPTAETDGCATTRFADADGDGFGDPAASTVGCLAPGWVADATDCDDAEPSVHPGVSETCDGVDEDCDGATDEDATDAAALFSDADGDGYGSTSIIACPADGVLVDGDCDDTSAATSPAGTDVPYDGVDQDCVGGDETDVDGDGYDSDLAGGADCDDDNVRVHPGASERCAGPDTDCDGVIGSATAVDTEALYVDADGDGYGSTPITACPAEGLVSVDGDCDDTSAATSPAATDVPYDGVDQDCVGGDQTDVDGDGYDSDLAGGADCDDDDPDVHPAVSEICDGVDQDCDGATDEEATDASPLFVDGDGDGYGSTAITACPADGLVAISGDCDDTRADSSPSGIEVPYDGVDQDCVDGDETDVDGDGFDSALAGGADCDDADADVHPGAPELCAGPDVDCDGEIGASIAIDATTWYEDADGDGFGDTASASIGCAGTSGWSAEPGDCDDGDATLGLALSPCPAYSGVCSTSTSWALHAYAHMPGGIESDLTLDIVGSAWDGAALVLTVDRVQTAWDYYPDYQYKGATWTETWRCDADGLWLEASAGTETHGYHLGTATWTWFENTWVKAYEDRLLIPDDFAAEVPWTTTTTTTVDLTQTTWDTGYAPSSPRTSTTNYTTTVTRTVTPGAETEVSTFVGDLEGIAYSAGADADVYHPGYGLVYAVIGPTYRLESYSP